MPHIYITGDTHAYVDYKKLTMKRFPEQKGLTREDVVIIAGDFGVPWAERLLQINDSMEKVRWLAFSISRRCTITIHGVDARARGAGGTGGNYGS